MNRVTASASGRLLQCSGHVRLPWLRETSDAANEGTRLHAVMETMSQHVMMNDAVRAEPLCKAAWEHIEEHILRTMGEIVWTQTERAFVLDTQTRKARHVELTGPRQYGVTQWSEIAGTIDAVLEVEPHNGECNVHVIVDWKFGMEPVSADSAQLRTLAAAYMLATYPQELEGVMVAIVQSNESGCEVRARWWTRDDLLAHVEVLGEALNEVHEGSITLQRGPECKYCPAVNACPSQLAAMSAIVAPGGPGPITPERAGQIWAEAKQARKRLDAIEDACKALAGADGLPLPGGKRLVLVERTRASMDAKALEAVARGHGASDGEIDACKKTTTYTTTQEIKA